MPSCCLDERSVDEAALKLAIEARSLLGLPAEHEVCSKEDWIVTLSNAPTALEFARHVIRHVPLLIQGCIDDRPGLRRWRSTQYLIDVMGDELVQVSLTPDGRADDLQALDDERKHVFALPMDVPMTFADLFAILRRINTSAAPKSIAYLQSQNSNLTVEAKDGSGDLSRLMRDVKETSDEDSHTGSSCGSFAWADAALGREPEATNLWIGTSKSRTSMHRDHYENLFTVVRGTKIFTLYPPCEAHLLCEDKPYDVYQWYRAVNDSWTLRPSDSPATPWIPIDPTEPPDSKRNAPHKRFAKSLPPLIVRVQAGQTLYLPAGWYHHVRQEGDEEGFCVCVNWWYDSAFAFSDRWAMEEFVKEIGQLSRG